MLVGDRVAGGASTGATLADAQPWHYWIAFVLLLQRPRHRAHRASRRVLPARLPAEASEAVDACVTPTPATTRTTPEPVDWGLAERVARRIAGREPLATSYLGGLARSVTSPTSPSQAEAAVTELTGLRPPTAAVATVLDRGGWVGANVASMRRLLAPVQRARSGARMAAEPGRPGRAPRRRRRARLPARLRRAAGARSVRPARPRGLVDRASPTTPSTTSGRTCSGSRSASRSGPATSGSGSRCTS